MAETLPTTTAADRGPPELTLAQKAIHTEVNVIGEQLLALCRMLDARSDVEKRDLAIARTQLQTGLMWLSRAITRPVGF